MLEIRRQKENTGSAQNFHFHLNWNPSQTFKQARAKMFRVRPRNTGGGGVELLCTLL